MQRRIQLMVLGVLVALIVAVPAIAHASVIPMTLEDMAVAADRIVEVRVGPTSSRWTHDPMTRERRAIVTDVRGTTVRTLKGEPADVFSLTQVGGAVGEERLVATDIPVFAAGERCILFIDENGVIGGTQGRLEIEDGYVPALGLPLAEVRYLIAEMTGVDVPSMTPGAVVAPLLADDAAASAAGLLEPAATVEPMAVTVFDSTFESGLTTGWTFAGTPTWATTTYRAQAGSYSLYGAGGGSGGVSAPGPVPLTVTAVATRTMNLSAYNTATLEWDVYSDMTVASNNWMNVALATSSSGPWYYPNASFTLGDSGGWQHMTLDLRSVTDYFGAGTLDFTGRSTVYVRLLFSHGTGTADEGVYVDNVRVTAANAVSPVIDSISPAYANAGVGDEITITGSDFGVAQGVGSVTFLRGDAQDGSRVSGTVVSWSDTQIVVEVPRLAETGGVVVNSDDGGSSASYTYKVGFSDSGMRWASPSVTYTINENTADMTGEGAAIQRAFASWSECGADFTLTYGGTNALSTYPPASRNYQCDIYFASSGLPTGVLGMNYYWYVGSTKLESDIIFNDADGDFAITWTDGAVSGSFDLETVALHELGHTVGLDDQYGDMDEAMGAGPSGSTRRELSSYDVAGAIYIWGSATGPDLTGPDAPIVTSSSHPLHTVAYDDPDPVFSFSASDASGIAGYSYTLDANATTVPDTVSEGTGTTRSYTGLADGQWYFHVRAVDGAGNWGETAHYRIQIDTTEPPAPVPLTVIEVEGASRFETAVETSKLAYPGTASTVVIATGLNWPDALGGAALAGAVDGPILLSDTDALPTVVKTEIGRLKATHAIVLGSESALGKGVVSDLQAAGLSVERIGGSNRYATADLIAAETIKRLGSYDGTAFVATGLNFPDALAASPMAAANGWPVYLANPAAAPQGLTDTMSDDGVTDILVLGSKTVVSDAYLSKFTSTFDSALRLYGANRYETGRAVAEYAAASGGLCFDGLAVGVGTNFPDALSGGVLCARKGSVLLLSDPYSLSAATASSLSTHCDDIDTVHFLGSSKALTDTVRSQVCNILE